MAFDGVEDDFLADARAGDLSGRDPAELELGVEFHGHLLRNRRIDRRAERIVDRREAGRTGAVDDREVLAIPSLVVPGAEHEQTQAQGVQDFEELLDLNGAFPVFKVRNESDAGPRHSRQLQLRDALPLAFGLNELADFCCGLLFRVLHVTER